MVSEYSPSVVADLNAMVKQGLPHWGVPAETGIKLLNLSENATFLLSVPPTAKDAAPDGSRDLVLRLHRIGYSSADEIRSELAWINALIAEKVIDTAQPVAGLDGDPVQALSSPAGYATRYAVAFRRVPGAEPEVGNDLPDWFERLGALTAKMHRHAKAWQRPEGFCRKLWNFDAMMGPDAFWGPWKNAIGLDMSGRNTLTEALTRIAERLDRYGSGPDRFGLVHADLRLANLLVDGPHLRIIDFDDCGLSWFAYDFAASVSFIEHEPVLPALRTAWLRGYRSIAGFAAEDEAMLPTFVVLRRILLTAWLASHAEIPFAQTQGAAFTAGTVAIARSYMDGTFLAVPE